MTMWGADGQVYFVSERDGLFNIWRTAPTGGAATQVTSSKDNAVWAPESKRLAVTAANRLFTIDIDTNLVTDVAYNQAGGYQVSQFSPDGKWLVYARSDDQQNREVYAFEIATKQEHNLTQSPFTDLRGALTPDGRKLVFLSDRADGVNQLFVVSLEKLAEDPDDPLAKERAKNALAEKKDANDAKDQPAPAFKVDADGIKRRAVQLTKGTEPAGGLFVSADGKLVYFTSADKKGRGLFSVAIDAKNRKRVSDGPFANLTPTKDRKKVVYAQDGEVYQMDLAGEKKKTRVEFTLAVKVDRHGEWAQMFDECWRVMKYRFSDEKMHGTDWPAIKARYDPLLSYVGENQDLYDIANEMIGEINEFWDKKGIVVDIRYNGGGNIDQELLDILERTPYEYWNNRWGSRTWGRRPRQAIAGPKVMLINWRSASDTSGV